MKRLTPLKIGSQGKLFGLDLTLKGVIQYVQRDEGKNYYWENIYAIDDKQQPYWIDYDKYSNKYTLYKEVNFDKKAFKDSGFKTIKLENGDYIKIIEQGVARVVGIVGYIPMDIQEKSTIFFIDAVGGKGQYSMEWDSNFMSLYAGQKIMAANLFDAFGLHELAKKERKKIQNRIRWRLIDKIVFWTLILGILGILSGLIFNRTILEKDILVCDEDSLVCEHNNQVGPISLPRFPLIMNIFVESTLPDVSIMGTEVWKTVMVEFINQKNEATNAVYFDLYNVYWVEGGESGKEKREKANKDVKIIDPGEYLLDIYVLSCPELNFRDHKVKIRIQTRLLNIVPFIVLCSSAILYFIFRLIKISR